MQCLFWGTHSPFPVVEQIKKGGNLGWIHFMVIRLEKAQISAKHFMPKNFNSPFQIQLIQTWTLILNMTVLRIRKRHIWVTPLSVYHMRILNLRKHWRDEVKFGKIAMNVIIMFLSACRMQNQKWKTKPTSVPSISGVPVFILKNTLGLSMEFFNDILKAR